MPYKDERKRAAYQRAYRDSNKESRREYNKTYWRRNKGVLGERNKQYYEKNKDGILESQKKYNEDNKVAIAARKREYHKKYYAKNKKWLLEKSKEHFNQNRRRCTERLKARRHQRADWLWSFKLGSCCLACGEKHPACLDFHHRDPSEKEGLISRLVNRAASMDRILAEIAKCDVLCANCHRKLHCKREYHGDNDQGD